MTGLITISVIFACSALGVILTYIVYPTKEESPYCACEDRSYTFGIDAAICDICKKHIAEDFEI